MHNLTNQLYQIECKIRQQLNLIMHHAQWQSLEASWRSLRALVSVYPAEANVVIKVLPVSLIEIKQDLAEGSGIENSQLFGKICREEYEQAGGTPFNLLLADFYFALDQKASMQLLVFLLSMAKAAFAPCITSVQLPMMHWENSQPSLESFTYQLQQYAQSALQTLKEDQLANYLGLIICRKLVRDVYQHFPCHGVLFEEQIACQQQLLWGNPIYPYAQNLIQRFLSQGCFAINNTLPPATASWRLAPWQGEYYFSPKYIRVLNQYGLMVFTDQLTAADDIGQWMNMLRFAHYIKVMMRDKLGSMYNAEECERYLQQWLTQYCIQQHTENSQRSMHYPLSAARVSVIKNTQGSDGFTCEIYLTPAHQQATKTFHWKL
jgi:type VI secretion system protein ImpD